MSEGLVGFDDQIICCNLRCCFEGKSEKIDREKIALICIRNEGVNRKSRVVVVGGYRGGN